MSHICMYIVAVLELSSNLNSVYTNLWQGRKSASFKEMYASNKSFLTHLSYMVTVVAVFMGYSLLTQSKVINEYPILVHLAYGAHFL